MGGVVTVVDGGKMDKRKMDRRRRIGLRLGGVEGSANCINEYLQLRERERERERPRVVRS